MARYGYERLCDAGASHLENETSRLFGHCGSVLVFDSGPLATADGGIDFAAIRHAVEATLHEAPVYRRKLRWVPFENHPIWVDDPEFNLDYHLRHTSLVRPGTIDQLGRLAARIQAQRLDRSRPLWELWVLEGLADGRFALLFKVHHALAATGHTNLLERLLSPEAAAPREPAPPYRPRPVPSVAELVLQEVVAAARLQRRALSRMGDWLQSPDDLRRRLRKRAERTARMLGYALAPQNDTPLEGAPGPHRRYEMASFPVSDARRVRSAMGGTLEDVVLATLSGGIGRYLRSHYLNPAVFDFRAALAVSAADASPPVFEERIVELPIWEADPERCHAEVCVRSDGMGFSNLKTRERRWTGAELARGSAALSARVPVSLRVVTAPGPTGPLHLEGARLEACYGKVPVAASGGLAVGVFRYGDALHFGLNADYDRIPDLHVLRGALESAFNALVETAARKGAPSLTLVGGA